MTFDHYLLLALTTASLTVFGLCADGINRSDKLNHEYRMEKLKRGCLDFPEQKKPD